MLVDGPIGRYLALIAVFFLAACEQAGRVPLLPNAIVGTKAVIRAHGKDLTLEIIDVTEKIVVSDLTDWNGHVTSRRHYYRGFYPVAGTEDDSQWEVDFDETLLDSIFPLAVGNETSFYGNMKDIDTGRSYNFWASIEVIGVRPFSLPSETVDVFVAEINTEYEWDGKRERKEELVYFSPDYAMNLKGIIHDGASQRYWRVTDIEKPGGSNLKPTPSRPRSSGTVMI